MVCDTFGLWLEKVILPASVPEPKGAEETFLCLVSQEVSADLEVVSAAGAFEGKEWQLSMEERFVFNLEIVKRGDGISEFEALPKRWIVERSLGWIDNYRRLRKDCEALCHFSRAWMLWAMINKMLHTLDPDL